jgi:hypothetical protein
MLESEKAMKFLILIAALLSAPFALSKEVTIEWTLATTDCAGGTVAPTDYIAMEIYVSAATIPASDIPCPTGATPDAPPATFSAKLTPAPGAGTAKTNLIGGATYYIRARVQTSEGWSNLSNQTTAKIPGRGKAPVIILR